MFYGLLCVQRSLESLYQAFISLIRVLLRFRFRNGLRRIEPVGDELFILANGPSLKQDLEEFPGLFLNRQLLCVNQFVLSDEFERLRPQYYIFLDIGFFRDKTIPRVAEVTHKVIDAFIAKTTWPLTIMIPAEGRNSRFCRELTASGIPVTFACFNRTRVDGWQPVRHCLYRSQAGMPPPQNVLIGALMAAITIGYKRIVVVGADHSWHQGLELGMDGILKSAENHFYDKQPWKVAYQHPERKQLTTVPDFFHELYRTFLSHQLIREFADSRGVTVINASRVTFIDAFERRKLSGYPWEDC
ncbi:MAG: hypothetical protein V2A67_08885 [Bacteroidota bacterium]